MRKKSSWSNPKQGKKIFVGSYETKKNGQRIFNLTNGTREISFESYSAAKAKGWVKVC